MSTREKLVRRADVKDEDIDEIIGIAAELQDADAAAKTGATVDEVRDVARELDIDPAYVDAAVNTLAKRRAEAAAKAEEEAEKAAAQARNLGFLGLGAVTAVGAVLLLIGVSLAITVFVTDAQMDELAAVERRAEANLDVVLERQASLAPQLVALSGGEAATLSGKVTTLQGAPDIEAKLAASDALGLAMAEALGSLPPATDPASQQMRADLQHEVSGIANRITVERRRYEEAHLEYEASLNGLAATVVQGIGLHP